MEIIHVGTLLSSFMPYSGRQSQMVVEVMRLHGVQETTVRPTLHVADAVLCENSSKERRLGDKDSLVP